VHQGSRFGLDGDSKTLLPFVIDANLSLVLDGKTEQTLKWDHRKRRIELRSLLF
jgi:hypothetical protein